MHFSSPGGQKSVSALLKLWDNGCWDSRRLRETSNQPVDKKLGNVLSHSELGLLRTAGRTMEALEKQTAIASVLTTRETKAAAWSTIIIGETNNNHKQGVEQTGGA